MGIDHSIKHRKISRVFLEGTLHQLISLLEKKKKVLTIGRRLCLLIGISTLQK
jgi:hypothetical protein